MNRVSPADLSEMHTRTDKIRNICILAHVDHGKTTLSDSLVCSNGVISSKLAGKLRYLDSTEEEQRRGITMHSSAISLLFDSNNSNNNSNSSKNNSKHENSDTLKTAIPSPDRYLINLVDSPGHLDFSSDVSTATRLCDGALIVVDVLEGICTQTHAVLFKALKERMRPCLILNKIDRLLIDMKLTSLEAFYHLRRLVEKANALAFTLVNSEIRLFEENKNLGVHEELNCEKLLEEWQLSPEKGNVMFASALDCWGFGIGKFSNLWANKLGINKNALQKYFFGDFSLDVKDKKIFKYDPQSNSSNKPIFSALVLDPIWSLYELAIINQNPTEAAKFAKENLGIEILPREINVRDPRSTIQAVFRKWISLSDAVLRMVVRCMPNPIEAQGNRIHTLLEYQPKLEVNNAQGNQGTVLNKIKKVKDDIKICNKNNDSDVVVFVSKMMPVKMNELSKIDAEMVRAKYNQDKDVSNVEGEEKKTSLNDDDEVFVALGRIFSGVLTRSTPLYVLNSRHDVFSEQVECDESNLDFNGDVPLSLAKTAEKIPPNSIGLYFCLGPSVTPVDEASAGNIVAIVGLDQFVLKTATLATSWATQPLKPITFQARPMVRVAVEPKSHTDLHKLEDGLKALFQYDPAVEIGVDVSGQHTMSCLGELHLEQCLKSLQDRFAKCEILASKPLVQYRESILQPDSTYSSSVLPFPWSDINNLADAHNGKYKQIIFPGISCSFSCFPLPKDIISLLEKKTDLLNECSELLGKNSFDDSKLFSIYNDVENSNDSNRLNNMSEIYLFLKEYCKIVNNKGKIEGVEGNEIHSSYINLGANKILNESLNINQTLNLLLSFGPQSLSTNMFTFNKNFNVLLSSDGDNNSGDDNYCFSLFNATKEQKQFFDSIWVKLKSSIIGGFQECVNSGPIMNEPLYGICFSIDQIDISLSTIQKFQPQLSIEDIYTLFRAKESTSSVFSNSANSSLYISSGQVITEVKNALKLCMLSCPLRIVEPIYVCDLQCDQSQLGNLYAVLSKRRGDVISDNVIDGTSLFILSATLPVSESFGFAQDLLKKTGGNATAPQLQFSHWDIIQIDPFWKPNTEEELEQYGDNYIGEHNIYRTKIDEVRKRKGLQTDQQVVISAEKQKNMNKKK